MQLMIMKGATDAVASPSPCGLAIPYAQQASRRRRRLQDVVKLRFERYDFNGLPTALKLSVNNIYGKRADSVTYKRDDRNLDAEAIMHDPLSWPIREAEMGADVGPTEKPSVAAVLLTATPTNRTSNATLRMPPTVSLASATVVGGAPSAFLHATHCRTMRYARPPLCELSRPYTYHFVIAIVGGLPLGLKGRRALAPSPPELPPPYLQGGLPPSANKGSDDAVAFSRGL